MPLSFPASAESTAPEAQRLLRFNSQLIDQALTLVAAHDAIGAPDYALRTGPHLRHVIEHYEALVLRAVDHVVDYDRRPRDRELERDTRVARARLNALKQHLLDWSGATLAQPLRVDGQAGVAGEFEFSTLSSIGRELVFVASHATHHYALLQLYCEQQGMVTDPSLGVAPATVAHALNSRTLSSHALTAPTTPDPTKEFACPTLQTTD